VEIALGIALGVAAATAVGWWVWRRRRELAPKRFPPRPRPKHPVVLIHGVMGFEKIAIAGMETEYFRGVGKRLRRGGIEVHTVSLSPTGAVAARARQLADFVGAIAAPHVHLIAHSMGGIDARYAIARLGLRDRVASLVTIASPHRGTPLADVGELVFDKLALGKILSIAGVETGAFYAVSSQRMKAFNQEVLDVSGVHYASVVATATKEHMHPALLPTYMILRESAGDNDGIVPGTSQEWGQVIARVEADHWAQIGWSGDFDAPKMYEEIVRDL